MEKLDVKPGTGQLEAAASEEIADLRRVVRDLVALSALPSIWVDGDFGRSVQNLADALRAALRASVLCVRVDLPDGSRFETAAAAGLATGKAPPHDVQLWLDAVPSGSTVLASLPRLNGSGPVNALPYPIYFHGREIGRFVAGYKADVFPAEHDQLLLHVGANQILLLLEKQRDESERKARRLAEERLHKTEHYYSQLMQALPVAVYTCDLDGRITQYNEAAARLWGRRPRIGEETWCGFTKVFNVDGTPIPQDEWPVAVAIREGRPVRGREVIVEKPDGSRSCILPHPDPIRDETGKIVGAVNVMVVLDELKRSQDAVRARDAQLRSLLTLMPAAVYSCDADGRITFFNRRAAELWGREPGLNDDHQKFCAAYKCWFGDRVLLPEETPMAVAAREGKSFRDLEPMFERPDGTRVPVLVNIDPIFDADGKPVGAINVFQDVTLLKKAQQELKTRQEYLQTVIENTPECVKVVAEDGTLLAMNSAGLCMVEADCLEQVVGKNIYDVIAPEFRDRFRAMNERVCAGSKERLEFQIIGLKGTRRWMETHAAPIRGPATGQTSQLAITRDVTEQKSAEDALRLYKEIFAASKDAIGIIGPDGTYREQNEAHRALLGLSDEEVKGKTPAVHLGREAFDAIARALQEEGKYRGEVRSRTKSGEPVDVDLSAFTVKDDCGRVLCHVGIKRDISDRKRAEEALRASEQRFRSLSVCTPVGIFTADLEGRCTYTNPRFCDLYGLTGRQALGRGWAEFVHPEDKQRVLDEWGAHTSSGKEYSSEFRWCHPVRGTRVVHVRAAPLLRDDGQPVGYIGTLEDITERNAAEEQLRASEARFRSLVNSVEGIVWECVLEPDGFRFTFVSQQAERLLGYPLEHWLNEQDFWQRHLHPDDRDWAVNFCVSATRDKKDHEFEYRMMAADGRIVWLRDIVSVVVVEDKPVKLVGVMVDVTERRRAEEALRESEERLRATFNQAAVGIAIATLEGRFVQVNHKFTEILGYSEEELRELKVTDLTHPDDLARTQENMRRVLSGDISSYVYEKRFWHKSGREVWALASVTVSRHSDAKPHRFIGVIEDITPRKQAEEALQRSEKLFRELADSMPQMVWAARPDGHLDYYNKRWYEYTGFPESYGDQSWIPVLHPDDVQRTLDTWYKAVQSGQPYQIEYRFKDRQSGAYRWFLGRAMPIRDDTGQIIRWFGTCTDIDDQKRAEETLEQTVAERTASLREAIAQMEEFSYSVSHDLRAPLRAINAYAEALVEEYGRLLDAQAHGYLEKIQRASKRMDQLTLDVLAYSRIARAQVELDTVNLDRLVHDVVHQYSECQHPTAMVQIEGPLLSVRAHETSLGQCIANLLTNALKFVPAGVQPRIRIRTSPCGQQVRLWVEDNGIGIKPEYHERIFQMFERVHPQGDFEGNGIGLTIVRKAIEKMGGKVGVESDGVSGSRFWLELQAAS